MAEVLHEDRCHADTCGESHEIGKLIQVLTHHDDHHRDAGQDATEPSLRGDQSFEVGDHSLPVRAETDALVGFRGGPVDGDLEPVQAALDQAFGPSGVSKVRFEFVLTSMPRAAA